MLSPDEIAQRRFLVALRGFDRDEVATFLAEVATEVRGLRARVAELQAELSRASSSERAPAGGDAQAAFRALGEETTRILVAAEESARDIEARAAAAAQAARDEAQREARETVERANRQAARTIAEAERRRDAVAAEIAGLRDERDRFVEGLRQSVASIGGVVGGLAEPSTAEDAPAEDAPATDDGPADTDAELLVAEDEQAASDDPIPASDPVLLDADDVEPDDSGEKADADAAEPAEDAEDADAEPTAPAEPTVESRRDERLSDVRPAMARQCKRGLQEIQNEVLASIRDHGRGAALDDLLPAEADLDDLGAVGAEHLAAAYNGALEDAAAELDEEPPTSLVDGARVQAAVATFRAVLAHEVISALRATLRAGLEAEEPEPQLSERVGEVFRDLRGPVVEATVDEHLQRTYGHGLLDAWEQLGVEHTVWQAREEARCPEGRCRTNAGEGPVVLGEDFPSGDRVPPAHPGCTCVVVPAS